MAVPIKTLEPLRFSAWSENKLQFSAQACDARGSTAGRYTKEQIDIFLSVDDFEKDIDNQITYLERAINHLQQKINIDDPSL